MMNIIRFNLKLFIIICTILLKDYVKLQRDPPEFLHLRRTLFGLLHKMENFEISKHVMQKEYPKSTKFFCDTKSGPGKRSSTRPNSVHELRPGDIDIVMAMGDSLTVGNGVVATNPLALFHETRGLSWSIGGQGTWRKYITLPNLLKEFNTNLYGYSLKTAMTYERASKFNVAEGGSMSRDMPYQAQVIINRLKHDPKVDMRNDWKVLTILIGSNDFCGDMCYRRNPRSVVKNHERELVKTLRILRDHIPRLFVNLVLPPNVELLRYFTNKPALCFFTHIMECTCFIGKSKNVVNLHKQIIEDWYKIDYEIANRSEFNTKDFVVSVQPFLAIPKIPKLENGSIDYNYLAPDCFHFNQKLHGIISIALWNNMLEPEGNKSKPENLTDFRMKCPTEEMPFLRTRKNSKIKN